MLWLSSESASPLECTLLRFQLPSSLESAVARLKDLKFLRMNRYRKGGRGGHLQTGSTIEKGSSAVAASCPPPLLNASQQA